MNKAVRQLLSGAGLVVLFLLFVSGCSSLFQKDYTIEVDNTSSIAADVYYQTGDSSGWQKAKTVLAGTTAYLDLPQGTYDFRAVWTGSDVNDASWIIGTETGCAVDYQFDFDGDTQSYDYQFNIHDTFVSFY